MYSDGQMDENNIQRVLLVISSVPIGNDPQTHAYVDSDLSFDVFRRLSHALSGFP